MLAAYRPWRSSANRGAQTSGNHLQGDDPHFALALLNVRDVSPIHIQMDGEISLRPSLAFSQRLDAFSQLNQKNVSASGHAPIVAILFATCVWHARQRIGATLRPEPLTIGSAKASATSNWPEPTCGYRDDRREA